MQDLFTQLSLFTAPLHGDPRCNKMSVVQFEIGNGFSRIEATDGSVAVVADVAELLPPQGEYLRLLETNFDFHRTNVLSLKKQDGVWHCDGLNSLDTIRISFPSGHRVDSRQLNRILRFFNWVGIESADMIFPNDPFCSISIVPEMGSDGTGLLSVYGLIAPIVDDGKDRDWIDAPLDEMPIPA